jgi:tetratricopeptide (TPR) repeat protein
MPRVLFSTGDAFFNVKSYDSALVYYQRVIKEYPASPLVADALAGRQYTFQAEGKPQQALAEIDTILAKRPEGIPREELFSRKGDILFGEGDFAGAIKEYQQLPALKPSILVLAKAYYQMGRAYELQGNPAKAVQNYQKILNDAPESEYAPGAALALGIALGKTKQHAAAIRCLQDFDKRFPDSPLRTEAHYQLGLEFFLAADAARSMEEFQSVIRIAPENVFADRSRLQIARLHQWKKEYASSFDTLNALLARRSDDLAAEALLMIAENYAAQKKYKDALQSYNDIIQQYKDYPLQVEKARFGLGTTYEKMKDRKQARLNYQEIVKSPVDQAMKSEAEKRLKKIK